MVVFFATYIPSTPLALIDQCTSQGAIMLPAKILNIPKINPAIVVVIMVASTPALAFVLLLPIIFFVVLFCSRVFIVGKICHNPNNTEDIIRAVT